MDLSLQELVDAYCSEPTSALREAIITEALPLVRSIVGKIRNPDTVLSQQEDLESAGIMGLLQALEKYNCDKEIRFNTFAYYRIRGSVIDYLRSIDQLPRGDRTLYGKAQEVISRLQQELGREPDDDEVADELEISLDQYQSLLGNVQLRAVLSLDQPASSQTPDLQLSDSIADEDSEQPDAAIEKEDNSEQIKEAISKLKERERLILALYYYEDLTLNEIAMLLGLSEARISQIVGKLLITLKGSLSKTSVNV